MDNDVRFSSRIGIVATNSTGYVEAMFDCMESGNVAVPLRSIDDRDRINAANVERVITPPAGDAWMSRDFIPAKTTEPAIISFTSGTEGAPKGVIITHRNLSEVVMRLNSVMQVDDSISEYVGIPVYHSFGFGRCRAVSTAGGRFFIPKNGFNPSEIGVMLKQGEINSISAVPSLWRVLLANKELIGDAGKRVRWIEIGSQYMSRQEKEELKVLFPEARIIQHYGLTEASRTTLLEVHQVEGELLESVGQALGGIKVRLTAEGRIAIRGEHVAQAYLIDGQESRLQDDDGWFQTKDLGRINDGFLYYEGRADDVINCGGVKIHPEALETKIYANIGCRHGLAVCRKPDPVRGEGILVAVTKEVSIDPSQLREVTLQATQELGVNASNAIAIVNVDTLPKTATGKIQRRQLTAWYTQQFPKQNQLMDTSRSERAPIQTIFCRSLNLRQIQPDDTFVSLGGDSLSYVQLSMDLERHLGQLPKGWENVSIAELEKLSPQRQRYTTVETDVLLRALSICGVVVNHADLLPSLSGGSILLLLIAGLNFARFQASTLFQGRFLQATFPLLRNLLIPYLLIAFIYDLWKRSFEPTVLLLISNFVGPHLGSIFPVWFIEVLVQCVILFSLLFSIQPVCKFANSSPWKFGLILVGLGTMTHALIPYLWDTRYLYDRVPHMLFWLFALGWTIHFTRSRVQTIITTIIVAMAASSLLGLNDGAGWWTLIGGAMLLWLPTIPVPKFLKNSVQMTGAAAYHIFLTHIIFIYMVKNLVGTNSSMIAAVSALLGGLLVWGTIRAIQNLLVDSKRIEVNPLKIFA